MFRVEAPELISFVRALALRAAEALGVRVDAPVLRLREVGRPAGEPSLERLGELEGTRSVSPGTAFGPLLPPAYDLT